MRDGRPFFYCIYGVVVLYNAKLNDYAKGCIQKSIVSIVSIVHYSGSTGCCDDK